MTVSSATSSSSTSPTGSTGTSSSSSSLSTDDFMTLLVDQLENQNPLSPTDTNQLLNQMVSFASYQQQSDTSSTLSSISTTLSAIASKLDVSV